jgi:hypothetical protein
VAKTAVVETASAMSAVAIVFEVSVSGPQASVSGVGWHKRTNESVLSGAVRRQWSKVRLE